MEFRKLVRWFQSRILSTQAGLWVGIGVLVGAFAGLGSLLLYNGVIIVSHFMLYGISGFTPPLPVGEGGNASYTAGIYRRMFIPVSTTLGGFISGYMVYKLTPGSEGLGVNTAINAFHNLKAKVSNRTPAVKLAASAVSIGAGGSAGRDGPVALISAVFGSFLSDVFRLEDHDRRIVMASAIGAGFGSIFMAPIGGAILSTEILYRRDFEVEALIPATVASVVGYAIFGYQFHYVPLFASSSALFAFTNPLALTLYAFAGLLAGLGGRFFIRVFDTVHLAFLRLRPVPAYVKPAIGGLFVGILAIFYPQVLGLGYGWVQLILSGNMLLLPLSVLVVLFFAKIFATSFTVGSGGAGGVFAPGIVTGAFMGAALGIVAHPLFPYTSVAEVTVVTMLSFFAGASKAPVSMLIMGTEMVGGLDMFLPLMVAITIAFFVSGNRNSIYDAQVLDRLHSPAHMLDYRNEVMDSISIREAMNTSHVDLQPGTSPLDAFYLLKANKMKGALIVDGGKAAGYVTLETLRAHLEDSTPVIGLSDAAPKTISVDRTVRDAIAILPDDPGISIVVLDSENRVAGTIGFKEIADAYESRFREYKIREMEEPADPGK